MSLKSVEFKLGHSSQLRVLLIRQVQIHTAAPHVYGMGNSVPDLGVDESSAALDQLDNLVLRGEVQRPGQRSLEVSL